LNKINLNDFFSLKPFGQIKPKSAETVLGLSSVKLCWSAVHQIKYGPGYFCTKNGYLLK